MIGGYLSYEHFVADFSHDIFYDTSMLHVTRYPCTNSYLSFMLLIQEKSRIRVVDGILCVPSCYCVKLSGFEAV